MTMPSTDLPYFPATAPDELAGSPDAALGLIVPVLDALAAVVDRPGPGDLHRRTPCRDWDVEQVRDHALGWVQFFAAALADPDRARPRLDPAAYRWADDDREASDVVRTAAASIEASVRGGVQQRRVVVSQSVMDGDAVLAMMLGEYLVHGWDLARSLGLDWTPDPVACDAARQFLETTVVPEYRSEDGGFIGPEVEVPGDAPALERLLGFAGRQPTWTATAGE